MGDRMTGDAARADGDEPRDGYASGVAMLSIERGGKAITLSTKARP